MDLSLYLCKTVSFQKLNMNDHNINAINFLVNVPNFRIMTRSDLQLENGYL